MAKEFFNGWMRPIIIESVGLLVIAAVAYGTFGAEIKQLRSESKNKVEREVFLTTCTHISQQLEDIKGSLSGKLDKEVFAEYRGRIQSQLDSIEHQGFITKISVDKIENAMTNLDKNYPK